MLTGALRPRLLPLVAHSFSPIASLASSYAFLAAPGTAGGYCSRRLGEDVVVAGRGVVPVDHGEHVGERPQVVDAAAHALAVAAPGARRTALGHIGVDVAGADAGGTPRQDRKAATQAIAPVASRSPCTTDGLIGVEVAVAQNQRATIRETRDNHGARANVDSATHTGAAVRPCGASPS